MQQKNMATFGIPSTLKEDPEEDKVSTDNIKAQGPQLEDGEEDGLKTGRSQWTSLSKAREERGFTVNTAAGKAPLDPKSQRPKSSKSIKSRGASAKGGRSGIDASP